MLKVRFRTISTPFRQPFTTSHETKTVQEALMVAIEYNGLRGIGEAPIEIPVSVYPNPSNGILNFELDQIHKELIVSVKNVLGQEIKNKKFSSY